MEKALIVKAFEEKHVIEMSGIRDAFYNAYTNANRKKNKKPWSLFSKRKKGEEITQDKILDVKFTLMEMDKADPDKEWINIIRQKGGK